MQKWMEIIKVHSMVIYLNSLYGKFAGEKLICPVCYNPFRLPKKRDSRKNHPIAKVGSYEFACQGCTEQIFTLTKDPENAIPIQDQKR